MIRTIVNWLSERGHLKLDIDAWTLTIKKALLVSVPVGALLMKYAAIVFDPLTILACLFVGIMLVVDVVTGIIYHVYIKQPPDRFDKRKVYKSTFEFGLLVAVIIIFSVFKLVMMQFEHSNIGFVVPYVDGGISGIFMTFLFLVFLILIKDFVDRSAKMGMPGANGLNDWLNNIISRTVHSGGVKPNDNADTSR